MSSAIYLYLKTHNKTGLKYLGKTEKADPYSYKGSGVRWLKHIKKHGYDVTTEILYVSSNIEDISSLGQYYSEIWNIVKDDNWANLIIENGRGGSLLGKNNGMFGKTHSIYAKEKFRTFARKRFGGKTYEQLYGKEKANELKKHRSISSKGKNNKGKNNPRYDHTIYTFFNETSFEKFTGTRYDFLFFSGLSKASVHLILNDKTKTIKHWKCF